MQNPKAMPTKDLLAAALAAADPNPFVRSWNERLESCLDALMERPEPLVFKTANAWCLSESAVTQMLGARIHSWVGCRRKRFRAKSLRILRPMLADPKPIVVAAAVCYMRNLGIDDDDVDRIVQLANHKSAIVRREVAATLGYLKTDLAITTLIRLSRDRAATVRDWATFGLGEICNVDTPAIREALWARVHDAHYPTRDEARLGLAKRGDRRIVPLIRQSLRADMVSDLPVEAAEALGAPELLPALKRLRKLWNLDRGLEDAIRKCGG